MAMGIFLVGLIACVIMDISVLYAMLFGYGCFFVQAHYDGYNSIDILRFSVAGIQKSRNILILFILIGMLTGSWRASGTIPYIVYNSVDWINPRFFVLSAFLLSTMMSSLIGTSFGTASIMGTVLIILAEINGVDLAMTAGAVLAGAYFGDRCSPMSSSARLVCDITNTDYYDNIGMWLQTVAIPYGLSIAAYVAFCRTESAQIIDAAFLQEFNLYFTFNWLLLLPALILIVLSLLKINVRINMLISVFLACLLCVFVQNISLIQVATALISGYVSPQDTQLGAMFSGGGIISMVRAGAIVLIASSYVGIFEATNMLRKIEGISAAVSSKIGAYGATLLAATGTSMLACNQTLAILMTDLLCSKNYSSKKRLALDIVNTTVLISGLIPWSIACAVPLAIMNADSSAIVYAFFLYLTPLWNLMIAKVLNK